MPDCNENYESEIQDGRNLRSVKCKYCNSIILKPSAAIFTTVEFQLPLMKQIVGENMIDVETLSLFWLVSDMLIFENVGFSNAVGNNKYLICADWVIKKMIDIWHGKPGKGKLRATDLDTISKNLEKCSWKTYKCKTRFKDIIFDNYEDALKKCNILLYQSDSSDQNEEISKTRKRINNQQSDYEYYNDKDLDDLPQSPSSSENEKTLTESQEELQCRSSIPKVIVSLPTKRNDNNSSKGTTANFNNNNNLTDLVLEPTCKCNEIKELLTIEVQALKSELLDVKSLINGVKEDVKENSNLMERFIMQSKRQWETIKLSLTYNTDQRIITPVNQELEQYFQELIPLTSVDDLKILNETLLEEEKRTFFINRLKRIGGKDTKQLLSNIIKNIITIETQKQCNWTGANGIITAMEGLPVLSSPLFESENICENCSVNLENSDLFKSCCIVATSQRDWCTPSARGIYEDDLPSCRARPPQIKDLSGFMSADSADDSIISISSEDEKDDKMEENLEKNSKIEAIIVQNEWEELPEGALEIMYFIEEFIMH
ncbi:hypothetical protein RN001_001199 [Aquatica leii]|uniref:DUF4806 domain-containing protein n=1 Tax=Aquatica leii TaxID=1421715 RepID=A0AAN7QMJ0_9COLE|nr:hypothetical protein RN001_001199 [Aquatica leii]